PVGSCPWCEFHITSGIVFFDIRDGTSQLLNDFAEVDALIREVRQLNVPSFDYARPLINTVITGRSIPPHLRAVSIDELTDDVFWLRLTTSFIVAGVLICFIAPPVGVIWTSVFSVWLVGVIITRSSRLKAVGDNIAESSRIFTENWTDEHDRRKS